MRSLLSPVLAAALVLAVLPAPHARAQAAAPAQPPHAAAHHEFVIDNFRT